MTVFDIGHKFGLYFLSRKNIILNFICMGFYENKKKCDNLSFKSICLLLGYEYTKD